MILPARYILRLAALGAPFWFLTLLGPMLAIVPLIWIFGLLALAVHESRSQPSLTSLEVHREIPKRLSYDEPAVVKLKIKNLDSKLLYLKLRDEIPDELAPAEQIFQIELDPGATATLSYSIRPYSRGAFEFGDVVAQVQWDRKFVEKDLRIPVETKVKVYPRFRGSSNYELLARIAQRDEAIRPRRVRGQGSDYESLQAYVPGIDPRFIEWKASAKRDTLICRNPQVEKGQHLALMVDSGRLMSGCIEGHSRLEHALEAAVRLSYVVRKRGDTLSVSVFSNQVEKFATRLKKHSIMPKVLETFCGVEQRGVESDYWKVTGRILSSLRQRSLVILFTHVLDAAGSKGLIRNLRRAASKHLVLCVVLCDPELEALSQSCPQSENEAWEVAAACDLLRRRRLALEQMKSYGVLVLECAPKQLNHQLIRRYLQIRKENLQ